MAWVNSGLGMDDKGVQRAESHAWETLSRWENLLTGFASFSWWRSRPRSIAWWCKRSRIWMVLVLVDPSSAPSPALEGSAARIVPPMSSSRKLQHSSASSFIFLHASENSLPVLELLSKKQLVFPNLFFYINQFCLPLGAVSSLGGYENLVKGGLLHQLVMGNL